MSLRTRIRNWLLKPLPGELVVAGVDVAADETYIAASTFRVVSIRELVRDEVARISAARPPIKIIDRAAAADIKAYVQDARDEEVIVKMLKRLARATPSPARHETPRAHLGVHARAFRLRCRAIAARLVATWCAVFRGRGAPR